MTSLTQVERDRRWKALSDEMGKEGYDALVFVANDYRGHKGSLRYVADYNLGHRYGYAVMERAREPVVVVPMNLEKAPRGDWVKDFRFARHTASELRDVLRELPRRSRVGIVGMAEVMRVEEYLFLTRELSDTKFEDASGLFERVRARKSKEEIRGAEEAAYIVDRCFERLLEVARPGLAEREIGAEMYRTAAGLGGEDFLFLTMYGELRNGRVEPVAGPPRDRVLGPTDQFIFSYELIGPSGFWVELSRMVVFAPPSEVQQRLNRAVARGMDAAQRAARPGATSTSLQKAIIQAVEAEGASSTYWSGHGIGQDVIEEPWIGLEVVQEAEAVRRSDVVLSEGMVLTWHPFVADKAGAGIAYMSDTYVVEATGARKFSELSVDLYRPHVRRTQPVQQLPAVEDEGRVPVLAGQAPARR